MSANINTSDLQSRGLTNWGQTGMGDTAAAGEAGATVNSSALLEEIRIASLQYAGAQQSANNAQGNGVVNAAGAPSIDGVSINFSAEDMAAALQVLQGKTQEAQIRTAKEGIEVSKVKQQNAHETAMKKLDEWIKKCKDAAAKQKALGIFGWVAKALAFVACAIAAVAATVLTGGAAAPLLAVAIVGMVASGISLASGISQAAGGPPLEISTLLTKACAALLKGLGVPEDKVEAASKIMAGALALVLCPAAIALDPALVGNMAGGIAMLATDDATKIAIVTAVFSLVASIGVGIAMAVMTGGASAADTVSKTLQTVSKAVQAGMGAVQGVNTAVMGGLNIGIAIDEHGAAMAQVDKKKIDALVLMLQKQMEEDRDQLKKVLDEIQQGVSIVSQMINEAGQSRAQISANLGKSLA